MRMDGGTIIIKVMGRDCWWPSSRREGPEGIQSSYPKFLRAKSGGEKTKKNGAQIGREGKRGGRDFFGNDARGQRSQWVGIDN